MLRKFIARFIYQFNLCLQSNVTQIGEGIPIQIDCLKTCWFASRKLKLNQNYTKCPNFHSIKNYASFFVCQMKLNSFSVRLQMEKLFIIINRKERSKLLFKFFRLLKFTVFFVHPKYVLKICWKHDRENFE